MSTGNINPGKATNRLTDTGSGLRKHGKRNSGPQRSFHCPTLASPGRIRTLMPILEKENAPYAVCQAAVWIVTDKADYYRLGTLFRRRRGSFDGDRQINAYEAVYAINSVTRLA